MVESVLFLNIVFISKNCVISVRQVGFSGDGA